MKIAQICQSFLEQVAEKLSSQFHHSKTEVQSLLIPLVSKLQIQLESSDFLPKLKQTASEFKITSPDLRSSCVGNTKNLQRLSTLNKIKTILEQKQKLQALLIYYQLCRFEGESADESILSIKGISFQQLQKHLQTVNAQIQKIQSSMSLKSTQNFKLNLGNQNFNASTLSVSVTNRSSQCLNFISKEEIREENPQKIQEEQCKVEQIRHLELPSNKLNNFVEKKEEMACKVSASPLQIKNDQDLIKELLFNKELEEEDSHILTQSIIDESTQKLSILGKILPQQEEQCENQSCLRAPKYLNEKLSSELNDLILNSSFKDQNNITQEYCQQAVNVEEFQEEAEIYLPTLRQNSAQQQSQQLKQKQQDQQQGEKREQGEIMIEFKVDIESKKETELSTMRSSSISARKQINKSTKMFLNKQQPEDSKKKINFLRKNTGRSCSSSKKMQSSIKQIRKKQPTQHMSLTKTMRNQEKQNSKRPQSVKKTVFSKSKRNLSIGGKSNDFKSVQIKGFKMQQSGEVEIKESFKKSNILKTKKKKEAEEEEEMNMKELDSLQLLENQNKKGVTPLNSVNSFFKNLKN